MSKNCLKVAQESHVDTQEASQILGISDAQFRSYAKKNGIAPVGSKPSPYPYGGRKCPVWDRRVINDLGNREAVAEMRARRQKWLAADAARRASCPPRPHLTQEQRLAPVKAKYPDWRDALPRACEMIFHLNRYAKYSDCAESDRQEIYSLKNALIRILYLCGLATEVRLHSSPSRPCYRCDEEFTDPSCARCEGRGWYVEMFVAFRFSVGGETYSWHQPRERVGFDYELTDPDVSAWRADKQVKPLMLGRGSIQAARDLITYIESSFTAVTPPPGATQLSSGPGVGDTSA